MSLHLFEVEILQADRPFVKRDDIRSTDVRACLAWVKFNLAPEASALLKELGHKPRLTFKVRELEEQLRLI